MFAKTFYPNYQRYVCRRHDVGVSFICFWVLLKMREFVPWGTQKDWSNVYSETRNVSIAKSQKIGNVFNPYIELSRRPARRRVLYRKTNGALQIWRKMVCFSRDFTFLINISNLIATPHKTNLQQGAYIHPLLSLIPGNFPRSLTRRLCHADEPQ